MCILAFKHKLHTLTCRDTAQSVYYHRQATRDVSAKNLLVFASDKVRIVRVSNHPKHWGQPAFIRHSASAFEKRLNPFLCPACSEAQLLHVQMIPGGDCFPPCRDARLPLFICSDKSSHAHPFARCLARFVDVAGQHQ